MAMKHKAFIFDYDNFASQLKEILINSLLTKQKWDLIKFIQHNFREIKDPDQGCPLDQTWEELTSRNNVCEFADFALTKFYEPANNIGLNSEWQETKEALKDIFEIVESDNIILGDLVGMNNIYFNPKKTGSYFQTPQQIVSNIEIVNQCLEKKPEYFHDLKYLLFMLKSAANYQKGLYITFSSGNF